MPSHTPRIALIFGGRSAEHDVSIRSAESVLDAIDRERFEPRLLGVSRTGELLARATDARPAEVLESGSPVRELSAWLGQCDVALPLIHGTTGEDGCLQGLLECLGMPYVGSGVFASSLCMDKGHFKTWLTAHGLPVGPYVTLDARALPSDLAEATRALQYPLFVKPANLGSSVGITRVQTPAELAAAIDVAAAHDPRVVIEQGLDARELEVAVLDDGQNPPLVSDVAEIVVPDGRWYDYETKYQSDAAELKVPADVDDATRTRLRELSLKTFRCVGARGLSRVDFFVGRQDGAIHVNEVNTLPGFTSVSMYPRLIEHAGVSYSDLITRLAEQALAGR